jgi:hypothetical protein
MQLDYKVLFIDDDGFDGFMGTLKEAINTHLQNNGFVLDGIEIKDEVALDSELLKNFNYDMIFIDNRFGDDECGIEFIKKIRNSKVYADIILCTAQSDIELIKNINSETAIYGFYYIKKGDDLYQHAYKIIDFKFNQELDTNVMRGIAMNEVAKFDSYIHKILIKDNLYKPQIFSKIKEKTTKRYEEVTNPEKEEKIWEKVKDPEKSTIYFESTMRKDFLYENVLINIDTLKDCYNAIKDKYGIDVLQKRNILAHQIEPRLSLDEIKKLRKDLIEYRKIFKRISDHFNIGSS